MPGMTNPLPQGSVGASSLYGASNSSTNPRRTSYASVAAGTASISSPNQSNSGHPGAFSHLMNPSLSSPMYTHQAQPDQSTGTSPQFPDAGMGLSSNTVFSERRGTDEPLLGTSDQRYYGHGTIWPGAGATGSDGFFKPTYLRTSKYMERLEAAHKAKVAAQIEASAAQSSNLGSLSANSSNVSLHKMRPSNRGMTYEIIESAPPHEDDGIPPLPSKWGEVDKFGGLETAADGLDVKYVGPSKLHEQEAVAARADHPMPSQCGIYYFEVTIISKGKEGMIGVGFSTTKASLEKLPGWEPESWAYHGDDGKTFCGQLQGKAYGPKFTTGDIIGCGINFTTKSAFFTKNGVFQGTAFRDLKDTDMYPSVGMKRPQAHLSVNFGQKPFTFDIDSLVAEEKAKAMREIHSTDFSKLHSGQEEGVLLKELIAQFLVHDGYVETAKAFATELESEAGALGKTLTARIDRTTVDDDLDASNRQQIRASILGGDIDKALKRTRAYYPQVLQDNSQIYFRLRCRKFVEMIRQSAEIGNDPPGKRGKTANGRATALAADDFEADMDLDDQMDGDDEWDEMGTKDADLAGKRHDLLQETLRYGQELGNEFKGDKSKMVHDTFKDIWSFYAYEDPTKSPVAHLLDRAGRVPVAEELNSAILVSLGKSSSAAIERLIQQTEVLVSDIGEEGGAAALINVNHDFLR